MPFQLHMRHPVKKGANGNRDWNHFGRVAALKGARRPDAAIKKEALLG
jgi:hypothetical protein